MLGRFMVNVLAPVVVALTVGLVILCVYNANQDDTYGPRAHVVAINPESGTVTIRFVAGGDRPPTSTDPEVTMPREVIQQMRPGQRVHAMYAPEQGKYIIVRLID